MTAVTQTLARLTATPVPAGDRARAAAAVQAVTTTAAAGASHPWITALSDVAVSLSTPPEAPVPGTPARLAASWAAYLTAAAAVASAESPGSPPGTPGSPPAAEPDYATAVVPAALAVGAEQGLRMAAVADAAAVGLEVAQRLDSLLGAALGEFDRVATIGHLAAVAAAGRLLGLSPDAMTHAYGISGTQAAGFTATAAEPVGALQIGKAACDAVEAAYLARDGYTAGGTGIEGRRGFAALLAPGAALDAAIPEPPAAPGPGAEPIDLSQTAEAFVERS